MRRFSQRTHLVTLSEINITPLLDLAFVLLIIFVITTPLLQQGIEMKLPSGGMPDRQFKRSDYRTIEVGFKSEDRGFVFFEGRRLPLDQLGPLLDREKQVNPNLVIFISADRTSPFQDVFDVTQLCAKRGLGMSFRAEAPER